MTHKEKCNQLKDVRRQIADKLGVDLHQRECTYKGECKGTCPRCEQEEKTLNKMLLSGKFALASVAVAALSMTGCGSDDVHTSHHKGDSERFWENSFNKILKDDDYCEPLAGDVVDVVDGEIVDGPGYDDIEGEPVYESGYDDDIEELDGDVAYVIEEEN